MENQESSVDQTLLEKFTVCIRRLARSDLRLQLFRKNSHSIDITPLVNFEDDYYLKLKNQALEFKGLIQGADEIAKQIFKNETLRRIKIQERDINFHCPDCLYLVEENENFICKKGIDPSTVEECKLFKRENLNGWLQHVNNKKDRIKLLKEILEDQDYFFDFSLLK